ncbi:LacI family transcriptional regulator [Lachnoclostridium sp. An196]|uniref:sugar ABC transporter substrate-binding protein n=1 Tax=Lachnoclostridium sp. An196 TaxID=1965583 RepID=UPI000B3A9635|nr:substrate-binding domain-containing protein [Lachnoclostridium sp. An196]OUP22263.1 LacI family transcriptional regulator [Lachnoclostridium sp. An196]
MKNNNKFFIASEVVMGFMVLVLAALMLGERNRDARAKVSVIVCDSDNSGWAAFKYGVRMAAEDRGIEVVIAATESVLSLEEEEALIKNEIDSGADAVIVQPVPDSGAEEMLKRVRKRVPVMLVESPLSGTGEGSALPVTGPDNYAMGAALAEKILEDYSGNLEGKTVGILSQTMDAEMTALRVDGFCDTLKNTGINLEWFVSGNFDDGGADYLESQARVDFVAALDDGSLTAAGERASEHGLHGAVVYGIAHSTQAAYYLDTGVVECLVVPDEFNVGYQSMSEIADSLEHFFHKEESREVLYTVIRRETLFSEENQEILFTMSQ